MILNDWYHYVGVRLPAVIFPVVIRPSGVLTPLISLSVSLFFLCLSAFLCCSAQVYCSMYLFQCFSIFPFLHISFIPSLFFSVLLLYTLYMYISLTLILMQPLTACCPWPLHPSLCNRNPLMYAAI